MIGNLITVAGAYTVYRLWGHHTGLAVFLIVVLLFQRSSLGIIAAENDRPQVWINLIATLIIIGLCIDSFIAV